MCAADAAWFVCALVVSWLHTESGAEALAAFFGASERSLLSDLFYVITVWASLLLFCDVCPVRPVENDGDAWQGNVFVKMGKTEMVPVMSSDTLDTIKKKVKHKFPRLDHLCFHGKLLDDGSTLASCGIQENQTLHGFIRLNGGGRGSGGGQAKIAKSRVSLVSGGDAQGGQSQGGGFQALSADEHSLRRLFDEIDIDQDGYLSFEELKKILRERKSNTGEAEIEALLSWMDLDQDGKIEYKEFKRAMLANTHLDQWVASTAISKLISNAFPVGTDDNPFAGVLGLSTEEVVKIFEGLVPDMTALIVEKILALKIAVQAAEAAQKKTQTGLSKFANFDMKVGQSCGDMRNFKEGVTGRVGEPSPDILKGMEEEHTLMPDSKVAFTTTNYRISTCPADEWKVVMEARQLREESVSRVLKTVAQHRNDNPVLQRAGLQDCEIIAIVLYTGPLFQVYNAILRNFPQQMLERNAGNLFPNTIHALVSAISKLMEHGEGLYDGMMVYRGLGGACLPSEFYKENANGIIGYCEFGFLSTTTNLHVAVEYSGVGQGNLVAKVLAKKLTSVDRGVRIKNLSQYPGEDEILFTPTSWIQPGTGEEQIIATDQGLVTLVPVNINAQLKINTIEEIQAKRKTIAITMLEQQLREIRRDLESLEIDQGIKNCAKMDTFCGSWMVKQGHANIEDTSNFTNDNSMWNSGIPRSITKECEKIVSVIKEQNSSYFNDDVQYRKVVQEAVGLKQLALQKVACWSEGTANSWDTKNYGLHEANRLATGETLRRLQACKKQSDQESVRQTRLLALKICKDLGIVVKSTDELEHDETGETPLMRQAAKGATSLCQLLVNAGADANAIDKKGRTALMYAAQAGQTETAITLVKHCGSHVEVDDGDWGNALIHAATGGHTDMVVLLIRECGADPNYKNSIGWSPIHRAGLGGHTSTVLALIESRADVNISISKDSGAWGPGGTVVDLCFSDEKRHDLAELLVKDYGGKELNTQNKVARKVHD